MSFMFYVWLRLKVEAFSNIEADQYNTSNTYWLLHYDAQLYTFLGFLDRSEISTWPVHILSIFSRHRFNDQDPNKTQLAYFGD